MTAEMREWMERLRSDPRQYVWVLATAATAAGVFLGSFFGVSAALDDGTGGPRTAVVGSLAVSGDRADGAMDADLDADADDARVRPAQSRGGRPSEIDSGARTRPQPDMADLLATRVAVPAFDESDLIHGGAGSRGSILAGPGIVPSSGAAAQTDWELLVPSARLKASIVRVGLAPGNTFGAPDNPEVIGWWELGPEPGEHGNVLLDGHRDFSDLEDVTGTGVCWALPDTQEGDAILVRDTEADVYFVYEVTESLAVRWDDADAVSYLEPSEDARLTLITCEGAFDQEAHNYAQRRIVVAMMVGVADVGA